ncbi:hypothetical protein Ndes2526B_g04475 [Nannochloris sp. 'desiccata']
MDAVILPPLPQTVWDTIVQLIFEPVLELKDALIQVQSLSLVSQSLRRACKNAVLRLDAHRSLDAHVAALAKLPIAVEYLDLDDFYNREYVLRSATFIEHSALTLKQVSAAVRCTNTLEKYPLLHTLTLHGQESFPKLYSAVFSNLKNLKILELRNYDHDLLTEEVPLDVLTKLETLTVRPRPNGKQYWLHGHEFPLKLKRLRLDGSLDSLQAVDFVPYPKYRLHDILAAAEEVVIESRSFSMTHSHGTDREYDNQSPIFPTTEMYLQWIARELLSAPVTLKCVEFRLLGLEGLIVGGHSLNATFFGHLALPELVDVLEELAPRGRLGDVHWSYNVETQSIFEVYCLRVWRN